MSRENRKKLICKDVSKTDQSHKKLSDVNVIVGRYKKTGILPGQNGSRGVYGDFSHVPSLTEAFEVVQKAADAFYTLPAEIRKQMGNDPSQLHLWLSDEKNYDAACDAGLIERVLENTDIPANGGISDETNQNNTESNSGGSDA
jgi:phage internal scaffolding protein